jgi:hypothetical protein
MIRISCIFLIAGMLVPPAAQAVQDGDELKDKPPGQQSAVSDRAVNEQILQTLTDIRDSQLSVLQAQVEILSILRAQAATAGTTSPHDAASVSGHRIGARGHKPKPSASLSAAR